MAKYQKIFLFLLRILMGWMFFYAGITKILDPKWTAAGYLKGAKVLTGFYYWLAGPNILPAINFVNEWGLTLLGVSLILGVFTRISSILGVLLMILYWVPLGLPHPNPHAYIVDEHIIYAAVLLFFASLESGQILGLGNWCLKLPICAKFPRFCNWLG